MNAIPFATLAPLRFLPPSPPTPTPNPSLPDDGHRARRPSAAGRVSPHGQAGEHHGRPARLKRVLVVDDDVRNIFAITSVLERQGMVVSFAENGRKGIEALKASPNVDVVLMDVMMPEMV
ncbi:MAG: response regulator [Deltaproteobacteria bacterium]|nr:response regulator [Deltaproteobacteria bacterium]